MVIEKSTDDSPCPEKTKSNAVRGGKKRSKLGSLSTKDTEKFGSRKMNPFKR